MASANDAGRDATTDTGASTGSDDASSPGDDAGDAGPVRPPCIELTHGFLDPADDCVYTGPCPQDCENGTASGYLCAPLPGNTDASLPTYPTVFASSNFIEVIGVVDAAYPWDAVAYQSCGALTCTRWSTGDHLDGGSAWPTDPCADAGDASEAWACPPQPGVLPQLTGCTAGAGPSLGGGDSGIPVNAVWCCPPFGH